jgi:hypothetical protein
LSEIRGGSGPKYIFFTHYVPLHPLKSFFCDKPMFFLKWLNKCIFLSVLNVKIGPRETNIKIFFRIFGFHDLPPVNLSNIYFRSLRGKATINVLCYVVFCLRFVFSLNSMGPEKNRSMKWCVWFFLGKLRKIIIKFLIEDLNFIRKDTVKWKNMLQPLHKVNGIWILFSNRDSPRWNYYP